MSNPALSLKFWKTLLTIPVITFILSLPQTSDTKENWALTVYGAFQTRGDIWSTFYSPDIETSYQLMALAVSRRIYSFSERIDLELEG
ncbi:MAG TPA: hypothetical protein VEF33_08010 [Syntrophales bacterium]|nr:hypothetical protein [Syntrophales bacterium]